MDTEGQLREAELKITRLEERVAAADKALSLAEKLSAARTTAIISVLLSLVAMAIAIFGRH